MLKTTCPFSKLSSDNPSNAFSYFFKSLNNFDFIESPCSSQQINTPKARHPTAPPPPSTSSTPPTLKTPPSPPHPPAAPSAPAESTQSSPSSAPFPLRKPQTIPPPTPSPQ